VSVGDAVTRYPGETIRLIAQMSLGTGALVMIGGTTAIVGFLPCPPALWWRCRVQPPPRWEGSSALRRR
jgi:hypothetical protein